MNIESELPENFDRLTDEEKVEELEKLEKEFDEESDSGLLKKRMVQELKRSYSD